MKTHSKHRGHSIKKGASKKTKPLMVIEGDHLVIKKTIKLPIQYNNVEVPVGIIYGLKFKDIPDGITLKIKRRGSIYPMELLQTIDVSKSEESKAEVSVIGYFDLEEWDDPLEPKLWLAMMDSAVKLTAVENDIALVGSNIIDNGSMVYLIEIQSDSQFIDVSIEEAEWIIDSVEKIARSIHFAMAEDRNKY